MVDADLLLIHGFWSSPATWDRLTSRLSADVELKGLRIHAFRYESPRPARLLGSPTRIPDFDDIANSLLVDLTVRMPGDTPLVIVTHSQGGLLLQRFLARMLTEGRGRELVRIRAIVMLACPIEGSEYLASLRAMVRLDRHPQSRQLRMFEEQIRDAQRIVLQQVVYAKKRDESHCPIPVYLYAGNTDNIVSRQSARSAFPMVEVLPGNHFTILDPDTPGSMTLPVLKGHILTALVAPPAMAPSGDPTSQTDLPSIQSRPDGAIGKQSSEASLSDFLISYQQSDRAWAEWIAWHLEAAGHTVVFQSGDFTPGTNWLQLMQNAVNRSARVIVIVSISYIGSMFRTDAWQHIWSQDPEGAQRRVIPVRVAECEPPELLAGIVGVDLFGITETQAIHRLHQAISHAFVGRAKPLASPNFPAPVALPGNAQAPAQTSSDPPTFPGRTYHINLQGAKGVQIGDGNTQMNQW